MNMFEKFVKLAGCPSMIFSEALGLLIGGIGVIFGYAMQELDTGYANWGIWATMGGIVAIIGLLLLGTEAVLLCIYAIYFVAKHRIIVSQDGLDVDCNLSHLLVALFIGLVIIATHSAALYNPNMLAWSSINGLYTVLQVAPWGVIIAAIWDLVDTIIYVNKNYSWRTQNEQN